MGGGGGEYSDGNSCQLSFRIKKEWWRRLVGEGGGLGGVLIKHVALVRMRRNRQVTVNAIGSNTVCFSYRICFW